ncbi:MAG: HK97 family phage prohead protease [Sedimentisphaerales bacterium]|nr:HK97 family phage prohead protease [Sedimentisphaerales bacterium]NLT75655.1 HK97 family phage prohead protease [Planctomycetota bacterium]
MDELREVADAAPIRRTAAARSLAGWYKQQMADIAAGRRACRRLVDNGEADEQTAAVVLGELDQRERDLQEGWAHSSLRREIESRSVPDDAFEVRGVSSRGGPALDDFRVTSTKTATQLHGEGIVYDQLSPDYFGFREKIARGACTQALATSDIRLLYNHNVDHLFARTSSATLELRETSHGVFFTGYLLPFDGPSYHLARLIDRADVSGCSFSFSGVTDRWVLKPGESDIRIIESIETIYDIGPVTMPWYPTTSVSATFANVERAAPVQSAADVYDYEQEEHDAFVADYERTQRLAAAEERLRSRRLDEMLARTRDSRLLTAMSRNREGRLRAYETKFSLKGRR